MGENGIGLCHSQTECAERINATWIRRLVRCMVFGVIETEGAHIKRRPIPGCVQILLS